MNHHESEFEMDRKIRELEHAMTANDEYMQKVEALNAELLAALKQARSAYPKDDRYRSNFLDQVDAAIAKAEAFKPDDDDENDQIISFSKP